MGVSILVLQSGHILEIQGSLRYWPERALFYEKQACFLKKGPTFPPPHSIPFLSVWHQNKILHNFHKRGQCSIVKHNIGLEYALTASINLICLPYQHVNKQALETSLNLLTLHEINFVAIDQNIRTLSSFTLMTKCLGFWLTYLLQKYMPV